MAPNAGNSKSGFELAVAGLLLSTCGVLFFQLFLLLLSLSLKDPYSIFLPVYAYLFVLNPLTFYLNMLLLLLHAVTHAGAPRAPLLVFLLKHLPRAARVVSFGTLLVGTPLWIQVVVTQETVGLAVGAMLVCIALVSLLTSGFKKILISCCHAGRGFVPALFALCISTGFLIIYNPILSFPNTNHYDLLIHTALHYLLIFDIFVIFILGITLLFLSISTPTEVQQAVIQAENFSIIALSVAFATLLVGVYLKAFVVVTDMAPVSVEAVEK